MITRIAFMLNAMIVLVLVALTSCAAGDESSRNSASGSMTGDGSHAVALGSTRPHDDDDDSDDGESDDEEDIPLTDVPEAVMSAAAAAVPGIVFEEAERERENGQTIYCLEGEADGVEYEVEVTVDGEVVEIETDDDD